MFWQSPDFAEVVFNVPGSVGDIDCEPGVFAALLLTECAQPPDSIEVYAVCIAKILRVGGLDKPYILQVWSIEFRF